MRLQSKHRKVLLERLEQALEEKAVLERVFKSTPRIGNFKYQENDINMFFVNKRIEDIKTALIENRID